MINLLNFFEQPSSSRQKQYEAIRAIIVEKMTYDKAAKKYGYKTGTLYTLVREAKAGRLNLFPEVKIGPQKRRTKESVCKQIIDYRTTNNLSAQDILQEFKKANINISVRTIERILSEAGFEKLKRRTFKERGITLKNKEVPSRATHLDFENLDPFSVDCPTAGIFFFLPYILDFKIMDVVQNCKLPSSSDIGSTQACLAMLALKLMGQERLSHIENYDKEPGLGVFAGLNVLPKKTYMNTYSCRGSEDMLNNFQQKILGKFMDTTPELYGGDYINLDFHSVPHYGDQSEMEKIWCGSKHKAMKGANTVFAQDSKNNMILYTRADILRKEEAQEIKKFVDYWKSLKKDIKETLVFDCKFTKYTVLNDLNNDDIKFITLRKRNAKLLKEIDSVSDGKWQKVHVNIPKRKYKKVKVYESEVLLNKCDKPFRQLIVKDNGRDNPAVIITNNKELSIKDVLIVYAKRWRVEKKIAELVAFFNLNALSSPLMIRIHFDILWTFIADSLYHYFAQDLRRFEHHDAKTLFRKFINMPGRIVYDGENFILKIRKRAHTPVLKSILKLQQPITVPWLNNKKLEIVWTA